MNNPKTGKITFDVDNLSHIVEVNEYGAADVQCFYGRGVRWYMSLRPTETVQSSANKLWPDGLTEEWILRLDNAIADLRTMVTL